MIYNALATIIRGKKYNLSQTLKDMDLYLKYDRINEEEYNILLKLMEDFPTTL